MRQLNRISRRSRYLRREPPKPRWYNSAMLALKLVGVAVVVTIAISAAFLSGIVVQAQERLVASMIGLTTSQGLVIEEVLYEGRDRTDFEALRELLEPFHGQNILMVDIDGMKRQMEALPWVRTVSVKRLLPNRLHISLQEYRPYALWRQPSGTVLVSSTGEVVDIEDLAPFTDLPVLSGAGAPERAAELFEALASEQQLAWRVTGAQLVSGRRWNVFLDGKITVRLPEDDPAAAWQRLAKVERTEAVLSKVIEGIDLRLPERLILRLVDEVMPNKVGQPA